MRAVTASLTTAIVALAFFANGSAAKDKDAAAAPEIVGRLGQCRALNEDKARLACYDREVSAFDSAVRDRKLVVIDQKEIRETRQTLFGIRLPRIRLFDSDGEAEVKEISSTISSIGKGDDGRIIFTLDDGAVWAQTDDWPLYSTVKVGQKVTLKRAALGSYFASFEKAVSVRVKRLK